MALLLAATLVIGALTEDVSDVAAEAGVAVVDLQGAANTTGLDPRTYLVAVGELAPPRPPLNAAIERRLDCIEGYESHGYPGAYNRSSGASGAFQFLGSTWRTTPQGRAGQSPFDYPAARDAARWMLGQGRAHEWVPVQLGWC